MLRKSLENQIASLSEKLTETEANYNKVSKREIESLEQKVSLLSIRPVVSEIGFRRIVIVFSITITITITITIALIVSNCK